MGFIASVIDSLHVQITWMLRLGEQDCIDWPIQGMHIMHIYFKIVLI